MKINKIAILMGVAGLVYGTSSNAFYNVDAALTAPTHWDYAYRYNATQDLFRLTTNSAITYGWPGFVKTTSGGYNSYSWNSLDGHFDDGDSSNDPTLPQTILPNGLNVEMIFNRSNTTWFDFTNPSSDNYPYSFADDTKIGSDNNVGTNVSQKVLLKYDNQTNDDYVLYLDISSMAGNITYLWIYSDISIPETTFQPYTFIASQMAVLFIPARSELVVERPATTSSAYFDAWYLKNVGLSNAYDAGYDDGYTDGENDMLLNGGLEGIITSIFDALTGILNVSIFGDITLGGLMLFPLVITLFIFIMKMVKAG